MKKKYTLPELKEKYWEFKKVIITRTEMIGNYTGTTQSLARTIYLDYKDTIEDFLIWLESFNN